MIVESVFRLVLALGIIAAGLSAFWLANRLILARTRLERRGLESLLPGIPGILYFTTPDCAPCRTQQRPALEQLKAKLGVDGVQVIEVNAAAQPELADFWGVLSVPTTFIIDSSGQPRRLNHGVQSAGALQNQIQEVELNRSLKLSALRGGS